jgi:formate hydrogenlyase subunit 6/NADH:ubiquinone oxidoreductase subunit I
LKRFALLSRWVFGIFFLWLLWETRYTGEDVIPAPVNAFFRLDPLAGSTAMMASRTLLSFFWPLLLVVPLTLVFGRLFCGWICPLGGALDLTARAGARKGKSAPGPPFRPGGVRLREGALVMVLAGSLAGLDLAGVLDPLSLLIRTLAMGVTPPLEAAARGILSLAYSAGGALRSVAEPPGRFAFSHLLSFRQPAFHLSLLFLLLGAALVFAETRERRAWCRTLCPAGALFGCLSARAPLAPRVAAASCVSCGKCASVCPMGALRQAQGLSTGTGKEPYSIRRKECSGCGACLEACPQGCISYGPGARPAGEAGPLSLSRRHFLAAAAAGAALPLAELALPRESALPADFIRPPGAAREKEFLRRCLRCGECMRVCLTNGIQPAGLETGAAGLWTPRLDMRLGYCEYNCTLCGQVCPTDAIAQMHPVEKRAARIGTAVFDRDLCIPYARGEQCLVCEEHCPTPRKAIVFEEGTVAGPKGPARVLLPRVVRGLCIGCGICENKCPLQGKAAIRVTRDGEDRAR